MTITVKDICKWSRHTGMYKNQLSINYRHRPITLAEAIQSNIALLITEYARTLLAKYKETHDPHRCTLINIAKRMAQGMIKIAKERSTTMKTRAWNNALSTLPPRHMSASIKSASIRKTHISSIPLLLRRLFNLFRMMKRCLPQHCFMILWKIRERP